MAHIVISYQAHAYNTNAFLDMFECAAAAGNVGHTCTLHISGLGLTALSLQPELFADKVHPKNTGKMLKSLPLYDVDEILVLRGDLGDDLVAQQCIQGHALADTVITWVHEFPTLAASDIQIHF